MDAKMQINLLAALVPVLVAILWYSPFGLGPLWGKIGVPIEKKSPGHVAALLAITYVAGYFIASHILRGIVIHQSGVYSMLAGDPDMKDKNSALFITVQGLMDKYGHNYRTFKHGAFHGYLVGLYLILPLLVIIGLAEKRKISWMLVHAVYATICLAVMGGIICQYMP